MPLNLETALDEFQEHVNADSTLIEVARDRRYQLIAELKARLGSSRFGSRVSLRRLTQLDPVHDVDLVLELEPAAYPEWGLPGPSAGEAVVLAKAGD